MNNSDKENVLNKSVINWVEVHMRIDKIVGYDFPVTIKCDTEGCRTTFTVTMPGDMRRVGVWSNTTDSVVHPQKLRERVLAKCPCCGKDHEVGIQCIPDLLLEQIPYDKSSDPVVAPQKYAGYYVEGKLED